MSVVDNLFNHDVTITIPGGEQLTVDLSANSWNRTTVADGYWLQSKTVYPFSARDIYLANCIDSANDRIDDIETAISNGTVNSLISMNNVIYSANDYWEELPATIAPSNSSKSAPSNTLTYMTLGMSSDIATEDINLQNDRTCIIQGNLTENSFNQILLTDSGMFYRSVSGDETTSMTGDKVDSYDLLETDKSFAQILDDSTIDDPGYWFLHKESSGRPVWTNINALGEYIDNRVNPDNVYVGWSANASGAEYPERKLVLFPPNSGNIASGIDPTDETYTSNSYAWTESGWASIPPLMSRSEIITRIDQGVTANAALKDFLSLFTANGVMNYYTNTGGLMRSECLEDGCYYFTSGDSEYKTTLGRPRSVVSSGTYINDNELYIFSSTTGSTTGYLPSAIVNRAHFAPGGEIDRGNSRGGKISYTTPVYIELAPFVFTEDGRNLPREWNIHFCIKGAGKFNRTIGNSNGEGPYKNLLTMPGLVDVSIVWTDETPELSGTAYNKDTAKTYYITEGESIMSRTYVGNAYYDGVTFPPNIGLLSAGRDIATIAKTIDYHQLISAGQITGGSAMKPWLRVCIKGVSAVPSEWSGWVNDNENMPSGTQVLGIEMNNVTYSANDIASTAIPMTIWTDDQTVTSYNGGNHEVFIEEFSDDRFMDFAYRYVNDLPTRRLSYTNENAQENLLGMNTSNPANTNSTNVLAR